MADLLKLCVVCGEDCAGMPRTKDAQGQYYHKECFERELEARKSRRAAANPEPPPRGGFEPKPMSMLEDIVEEAAGSAESQRKCSSCGNPLAVNDVICMSCGFNTQTGHAMQVNVQKNAKGDGGNKSELASAILHSPFAVSMILLVVLEAILFIIYSTGSEDLAMALYLITEVFFLASGIFVLVIAFMESVGQGFLTLCLPFYSIYFVFCVTDNQWARWLFVVSIIVNITDILLFGLV